jgi:N-acyl-D-aspartate/D-glutamate deacylase
MPDAIAQPALVIRGTFLIDGSGNPGVRGDLAVKDDRIVAMGDLVKLKGAREIKANGLALAPASSTPTPDDRAL